MKSIVFIKPIEGDLTDCVRESFDIFGGAESLCKGKVFIKINGTAANPGAITSPDLILSTVKVISEVINPKDIYVFENSAVTTFTRLVFQVENLAKRLKKLGVKPLYLDEQKSMLINFNGAVLDKPIPISKILYENLVFNKDENTYINIPKLKAHIQCKVTICIKNQYGLLYDSEKVFKHHLIDEKLIDIMNLFKPDFNIVDAASVVDYGPVPYSDDYIYPMNLLISGRDPVAVDRICSRLIGIDNVGHIDLAAKKGFGTNNSKYIKVLPSEDFIDRYKVQLHHEMDEMPDKPPAEVKFFRGDKKACKTGCAISEAGFALISKYVKARPCVVIYGKGHDTGEIDKHKGPFVVIGPCSVGELKDYFKKRKKKDKIKVYFIDEHEDLAQMAAYARKAMKAKLLDFKDMLPCSIGKVILLQIISKLHGGKFLWKK